MFHWNKGQAVFHSKISLPGFQLGSFYVNEVSKLCSSDWTKPVSVISRKKKPGFPCKGWFRQHKQVGVSWEFSLKFFLGYTEYVRSPCQQMVAKHLLFIKFEPLVNNGEFIPLDEYFLKVHMNWIFLLSVHTPSTPPIISNTTYTHVFDKRISTCQNSLLSYSQIYSMFYLTNTLRLLSGTPNLIFLKLNSWTSFPTLSLFWWFLSHLRAIPIIRFYKPEY